MKSACERIEDRIGILVCIPVIRVSRNALLAFWSKPSHVGAVTMIFASRLSKSVVTVAGRPDTRFVSTRIPLPCGKWKDCILPILNDQFFVGSSAVMRNCNELNLGIWWFVSELRVRSRSCNEAPRKISN